MGPALVKKNMPETVCRSHSQRRCWPADRAALIGTSLTECDGLHCGYSTIGIPKPWGVSGLDYGEGEKIGVFLTGSSPGYDV